ncbi:hypothetical protein C7212DRAFT_366271 [Tuber magnatum]|uniref:MFS general substrate transporter n=1 Tax=Tuber magnatum TaxID=42249 RepID=A0A317SES0_9PEZI|nr:hypothetical protein C7212DRAFT_366271 [Tuber magnatum]
MYDLKLGVTVPRQSIAHLALRDGFEEALIQVLQWSLVSALEDKIVHILFFQDKDEYGLDSRISSLIYLVPLVGLFIGQLWGYFFNRRLQNRDIEKHSSIIPETVFIGCYLPILVEFVGFLAFALSSHHRYNWIGLVLGWGFVVFAASNILVATSVYTLYCFPAHAASTAAVLGFLRAAAAFTSQFYATGWVAKVGTYGCLGIQAAGLSICALLVVTVQRSGEGWRKRFHWDGEVKVVELPLLTLSEPATAAEEAGAGLTTGVWDGT